MTASQPGQPFSGRTIWIRNLQTPLREFLRKEIGGASVLLSAVIAALVWVNVDASPYEALWGTTLSIDVGEAGIVLGLLALVGRRLPDRLRTFILTVVVVHDIFRARRHRDGLHRTGQGLGAARRPGRVRSSPHRTQAQRASGPTFEHKCGVGAFRDRHSLSG